MPARSARTRRAAAHLLLCLLGAVPASAQTTGQDVPDGISDDRVRQVENGLMPYVPVEGLDGWRLADRMRFHRVPGLSIAVVHNYRVVWAKAYGLADTTARVPVTTETLFSAGSISKFAAAATALALAQRGALDLDAPVNTILRAWKLADNEFTRARPVTLRLLLSHQGGTSQASYWGFVPGQYEGPLPSLTDILSGRPGAGSRAVVVNRAPGAGFQYSGGGYLVAQRAMTDAAGEPFEALADRELFRPLGMRGATFAQPLPATLAERAAWAYSENAWFEGQPYMYPQLAAAGLYATPTDLAKLLIEVQQAYRGRGRVLTRASARAMLTPLAEVSSGTYREEIGLGAFLLRRADRSSEGDRYFEHTGVNAGFVAYALASVTGGNGVVVMMNHDGGAAELGREVRRAVARAYGWPGFLPDPVRPADRPEATLDAYAGRYRRGPDEVVTFRRERGHLVETINAGPPILCYPVGASGDTLAFTDFAVRGVFTRSADGAVDGFRYLGSDQPLPRLRPDELLPNELLRAGRLPDAVLAYRTLGLSDSQLTYLAYELLNPNRFPRPGPQDVAAAEGILLMAREAFPASSMVLARLGDLYTRKGDTGRARASFEAALRLDPADADVAAKLRRLPPE